MSQITFNKSAIPQQHAADAALSDLTNRLFAESKQAGNNNAAPLVQHIRASKRDLETENEQETGARIPPNVRSDLRNSAFISQVFQTSTIDAPLPELIPKGFFNKTPLAVYANDGAKISTGTNKIITNDLMLSKRHYGQAYKSISAMKNTLFEGSLLFTQRVSADEIKAGGHAIEADTIGMLNQNLLYGNAEASERAKFVQRLTNDIGFFDNLYAPLGTPMTLTESAGIGLRNIVLTYQYKGPARLCNIWLWCNKPMLEGSHLWLVLVRRTEGLEYWEYCNPGKVAPRDQYLDSLGQQRPTYWRLEPHVQERSGSPDEHIYNSALWNGLALYVGRVTRSVSCMSEALQYRSVIEDNLFRATDQPRPTGVDAVRIPLVDVHIDIRRRH